MLLDEIPWLTEADVRKYCPSGNTESGGSAGGAHKVGAQGGRYIGDVDIDLEAIALQIQQDLEELHGGPDAAETGSEDHFYLKFLGGGWTLAFVWGSP